MPSPCCPLQSPGPRDQDPAIGDFGGRVERAGAGGVNILIDAVIERRERVGTLVGICRSRAAAIEQEGAVSLFRLAVALCAYSATCPIAVWLI